MPTEARRIIFSNAELYDALHQQLVRTGSGLIAEAITRVRGDAPRDLVKIDVATGEDGPATTLEFPAAQVGEALIDYCLANKIPLPRAFSKSLIIRGDNVALEISNATGDLFAKATVWQTLLCRLLDTRAIWSVRKWSLARASVYGLAFQIMVIWLADRAWGNDQWGGITFNLDSGTRQGMTMAISALLPGPLLFVLGAWVRGTIVKRTKRPHRYFPKTLDFRHQREAAPLSTAFFALVLAFLVVALGGPLVISQSGRVLQGQDSTPSVALSSSTPEGTSSPSLFSSSNSSAEPGSIGNGFDNGRSTDPGLPPPAMLVQKGTVQLLGTSPVKVIFRQRFGATPNVAIFNMGSYPGGATPLIQDVTSTSFEVHRVGGADSERSRMEVEWIAKGPSPK